MNADSESSKAERASAVGAADDALLWCSAAELSRMICDKIVSSVQVVRAHIDQIERVQPHINAVTQERFESALREAQLADDQRKDQGVGPLHGVPISVKQMIDVEGMPTGWGTDGAPELIAERDAPSVAQMRAAGAIVLARTNVPQLGFLLESDNPVHGKTNNPWNLDRSSGGSSGGEAALIAAGGVPLGVASDLGGSIRIPAHCCGIHGLKPTPHATSNSGMLCLGLGYALECVVGPMARSVEDIWLGFCVMTDPARSGERSALPRELRDVDIRKLRVAVWESDPFFPASSALRRAIRESAQALKDRGATVVGFSPPSCRDAMGLYLGLLSADGGAEIRRELAGSQVDRRLTKLLRLGSLPRPFRSSLAAAARWAGQEIEAHLLGSARRRSTDDYWRLCQSLFDLRRDFHLTMNADSIDLIVMPPYGLPALPHGRSVDLLAAAGYAFFPNLVGCPAGVLSVTQVREDELTDRPDSKDRVVKLAARCEASSVGLPVGVQLMARPWREDIVVASMLAIESGVTLPRPRMKFAD